MKYYFFTNSVNVLCSRISPNSIYRVNEPYSYRFLRNFTKAIDNFRLPAYMLEHRAKWTDLISVINLGYSNLVISEKFVEILERFEIPNYEQHPVKIIKNKKESSYQFFHFLEAQDHLIDFRQSKFFKKQRHEITTEGIKFQDLNDYLKQAEILQKEHGRSSSYKAQKIYFKSLENYDLLLFKSLYGVTIISQRLAEAILATGITGVDIMPIEEYEKIEFIFQETKNV